MHRASLSTIVCSLAVMLLAPASVLAQSAPQAAPTTAPGDAPICTDRPTKANATCTVPAGHWQIETDLANWSHMSDGGVSTDAVLAPNPTLKYGLIDTLDVELNIAPYEELRIKAGGVTQDASGVGDLYARLKWAVVSNATWSLSLIPYVKAPTASHMIGNGEVEGGLAVPVNFSLPDKVSLTFGPELDSLENAALDGHHLNMVQLVNLSRPVTGKLGLAVEYWADQNWDPLETVAQRSADVAATYALSNTLQLDAGVNFGLNRATPRSQLYVGVSKRW
ncbi:MAG TPA: transporter [Caulobacteraceae bacterium]|jgi:hypothetical protein|nr:transporter [Caulobacteraceae bacterium]